MDTSTALTITGAITLAVALGILLYASLRRVKAVAKVEGRIEAATTEALLDTSASMLHQAISLRDSKLAAAKELADQAANQTVRIEQMHARMAAMLQPPPAPKPETVITTINTLG